MRELVCDTKYICMPTHTKNLAKIPNKDYRKLVSLGLVYLNSGVVYECMGDLKIRRLFNKDDELLYHIGVLPIDNADYKLNVYRSHQFSCHTDSPISYLKSMLTVDTSSVIEPRMDIIDCVKDYVDSTSSIESIIIYLYNIGIIDLKLNNNSLYSYVVLEGKYKCSLFELINTVKFCLYGLGRFKI